MRSPVQLRTARDSDAAALVAIWSDVMRKGDREQQLDDIRHVIDRLSATPEERIVVAELDGDVVGAVHLRATTWSPVNVERVLQLSSLHVLPEHRRHGIGGALMQAAVEFADELAVDHVGIAVGAGSRDSNRFMARLGLGPAATLRLAPTATVTNRLLASHRPTLARGGARQLTHVLAARRSLRRHQPSRG